MQIKLSRNLGLNGLRHPFTRVHDGFDLGKGIVSLTGNNVAGFFTTIPVSDVGYRNQTPTMARAAYALKGGWHQFTIWDDYGMPHVVAISDDEEGRKLAAAQVESLKANKLLKAGSKSDDSEEE